MPIRRVSNNNGQTTQVISATTGGTTKVKRVTLGRPVTRVNPAADCCDFKDIGGISIDSVEDGDVLVYHESDEQWHAQKLLDKQEINGGQY